MKIALILDNPYRDLFNLIMLAVSLCRRGATCYLVPMNLMEKEVSAIAPDLVLLNYLRQNNQNLVRQWMDAGIHISILDTETGAETKSSSYEQIMADDASVRDRVDTFFCWGKEMARFLTQKGWYRKNQTVVTGAIYSDLYAPKWRHTVLQQSHYAEKYGSPLILINGNLSLANPAFQTPEKELQEVVDRSRLSYDYVLKWQEQQKIALSELTRLTNRLAEKLPKVQFVYRPHPFERIETYHELLLKRNNLHLVKEGTIYGWILRSQAIIHRDCTTAIEANFAGIPAFSANWIPASPDSPGVSESVSVPCQSQEELEKNIEDLLNGKFVMPAQVHDRFQKLIGDWFHRFDGSAHERIASKLLDVTKVKRCGKVDLSRCRKIFYGVQNPQSSLLSQVTNWARMVMNLPVNWSFHRGKSIFFNEKWDQSEKKFDVYQVQEIIEAISSYGNHDNRAKQNRIDAAPAKERNEYHFNYKLGKSMSLEAGD